MNTFEQDRAGKLRRLHVLRIMNTLGMVAWREDRYGGAQQRLRMLHPLSWPWTLGAVLFGVLWHGLADTAKEIKRLPEDMVWW
jgi:hypothetical protein